ncbi:MAG: hypothetical protein PUF50_04925 [Erysipelotrichaceae bacterium]|nr:hypothetical protein [Erysipelotrichaceae bacterium]
MPSIVTHRLFADDVYAKIEKGTVHTAIAQGFELYSIGSNGPDLFFFHGAWPWVKREVAHKVSQYGSWMHAENVQLLFETMFQRCKETQNSLHIAYTAGVLAHWCLDHKAHPYVFNQTGYGTSESGHFHCLFESIIDREMLNRKQIRIQAFKPYDIVRYQSTTAVPIYELYSEVLKKGWDVTLTQQEIQQCLKDFYRIERFLYDPNGWKVKLVSWLEKPMHIEGYASSMFIPKNNYLQLDVMNDAHRLWHHPSTNEESHASFLELYQEGVQVALDLFQKFDAYLKDEISLEDLMETIGNRNFHTGLPVKDDFKYFDLMKK